MVSLGVDNFAIRLRISNNSLCAVFAGAGSERVDLESKVTRLERERGKGAERRIVSGYNFLALGIAAAAVYLLRFSWCVRMQWRRGFVIILPSSMVLSFFFCC